MASIVLSFVGNQDPYSDNTNVEGSIVSLIQHLRNQQKSIKQVTLLYTEGTKVNAEDTKTWLEDEPLKLPEKNIELIPVSEKLSEDPVNLLLAIEAARQGVEKAQLYLTPGDRLELNASSGTPVMKSAWSSLQAAGYLPNSSIWQVRNPKLKSDEQARVFETNVDTLKKEFDLKVIRQQITDYNYSGALITLQNSGLSDNGVSNLLRYGNCRLSCDFEKAAKQIIPFGNLIDPRFVNEIKLLANRSKLDSIKEMYFHAIVRLKTQEYCNFLVLVFAFQESVLRYLITEKFLPESLKKSWRNIESQVFDKLKSYNNGQIYNQIKPKYLNRPAMLSALKYFSEYSNLIQPLSKLDQYCEQRNDYIHQFEGVSSLENEQEVLSNMKEVLAQLEITVSENSFTLLNKEINSRLQG